MLARLPSWLGAAWFDHAAATARAVGLALIAAAFLSEDRSGLALFVIGLIFLGSGPVLARASDRLKPGGQNDRI